LVNLNHYYENISLGFYHRADDRSVPGLVCEEGTGHQRHFYYCDDPRRVDDQEEDLDFCGSVGVAGEEDREEEGGG
jgi:hypothetical protein